MDAGKQIIDGIFAVNRRLEIPFYQRTYVWTEDQWERFKDDMEYISITRKPYFLGSVILKQAPTPSYASSARVTDTRVVIDGQQRMTTIMLFFKALYLRKNLNDYFITDFCLQDGSPKLAHGRADQEAFRKVIDIEKLDEGEQVEELEYQSNIIDAFNYFFKNINPDKLDDIAIKQFVTLIGIDIAQSEDEQQIFDTINSLGVKLTTAELLKNHLFNRDNEKDYEEYWESIFEKDPEEREWWDAEVVTGRLKRTIVDLFFDSLLQILVQNPKYGVSAEDKIAYAKVDQLFHSYQDFLAEYYTKQHDASDGNIPFLKEMSEYAKLFRQTFDPAATESSVMADDYLKRINVVIFGLKNSTLIPYILYLTKYVHDVNQRNEMLKILESYIMRRMVTRDTTKNYNRLFNSLILRGIDTSDALAEALKSGDDTTTRFPSDADLIMAFENEYKLTNLQTKGILYLMEASIRPKNSGTDILRFNAYSLEHLMPKKWRNNWDIPDTEEAQRERDRKLLTLGNLAIITQSLNASIRDAAWVRKCEGKGKEKPGLRACSTGLTTFEGVLEKDTWSEKEIGKRGERLAAEAVQVWPYPDAL